MTAANERSTPHIAPSRWWEALDQRLPAQLTVKDGPSRLSDAHWDRALLAPVRDILSRPGKAFRARLVELAHGLVAPERPVPPAALALVETLHAGSLVVDDVEDGSIERRGAPSLHLIYGMPRALNAGCWMYFAAIDQAEALGLDAGATLALYRRCNQTLLDCHRGQALDLGLRVGEVAQAEVLPAVLETSLLKTAALTALACWVGGLAAGAGPVALRALEDFGRALGLALQQLDDLGNLTSSRDPGKRHEDLRNGRLTWPWAWAAETLEPLAYARLELAARALRSGDAAGAPGSGQAAEVAARLADLAGPHRRRYIATQVQRALAALEQHFPDRDRIAGLAAEITRLEQSYG